MKGTYTIQDLAAMTGLNERTIRSYLANGQLQGTKTGGAWQFTPEQFSDFLEQNMVRGSVQAKANAIVYDFLITNRRTSDAACLILDCPLPQRRRTCAAEKPGNSSQCLGSALGLPEP